MARAAQIRIFTRTQAIGMFVGILALGSTAVFLYKLVGEGFSVY